jgi:hypothetical protein
VQSFSFIFLGKVQKMSSPSSLRFRNVTSIIKDMKKMKMAASTPKPAQMASQIVSISSC